MTEFTRLLMSLRNENGFGRGIASPTLFHALSTDPAEMMRLVDMSKLELQARGKHIIFVTHGFNVPYKDGATALRTLEKNLGLGPDKLFIGILWPGDYWLPVVNYPFEASDAVICGNSIAALCNDKLRHAASFSFISHSLGGRLILQAASRMPKVKMLCLTAAAVDKDVLSSRQYRAAYDRCEKIYVLSSRCDQVLKWAYPAGDFLSDIFGDKDSPYRGALGRQGPEPSPGAKVDHFAIPKQPPSGHSSKYYGYDHGDYMPSGGTKWPAVANYMKGAVAGQIPPWP